MRPASALLPRLHRVGVVLAGAMMMATGLSGAPRQATEPEAVASAYLQALKQDDRSRLAALMHQDELRDLKQAFSGAIARDDRLGIADIFGVRNAAAFDRLTPEEVFIRLVAARSEEQQFLARQATYTIVGREPDVEPGVVVVLHRVTFDWPTILQCDRSDPDCPPAGAPDSLDSHLRLKRQGSEWRMLLAPDLKAFVDTLIG